MLSATKKNQTGTEIEAEIAEIEARIRESQHEHRFVDDLRQRAQTRHLQGPDEASALNDLRASYPNADIRDAPLYQAALRIAGLIERRIEDYRIKVGSLTSQLHKIEAEAGTGSRRQMKAIEESREYNERAWQHLDKQRREYIREGYIKNRSGALTELPAIEAQLMAVERELERLAVAAEIVEEG